MDRKTAQTVSNAIKDQLASTTSFTKEAFSDPETKLRLHGADIVGAYLISYKGLLLNITIVNWRPDIDPRRYYIIIGEENNKVLIHEIHEINNNNFEWKYKPTKRDGKNPKRKEIFQALMRESNLQFNRPSKVLISIPRSPDEAERFLEEIFKLTKIKTDAHELRSS